MGKSIFESAFNVGGMSATNIKTRKSKHIRTSKKGKKFYAGRRIAKPTLTGKAKPVYVVDVQIPSYLKRVSTNQLEGDLRGVESRVAKKDYAHARELIFIEKANKELKRRNR